MKCPRCGSDQMTLNRENFLYSSSGLSNIVLEDIEVRHCANCGDRQAVIPRIEELHKQIALHISTQKSRLSPEEIRFLRKYLGWSGADFSRKFDVAAETVSRWENGSQDIGPMAETLLRMWVALGESTQNYAKEILEHVADKEEPRNLPLRASHKRGWKLAAA